MRRNIRAFALTVLVLLAFFAGGVGLAPLSKYAPGVMVGLLLALTFAFVFTIVREHTE